MKNLIIRECAINACGRTNNGKKLLYLICKEAMTGEQIDWDEEFPSYYSEELRPLYDAIAPDIIDSVSEEGEVEVDVEAMVLDDVCEDILDAIANALGATEVHAEIVPDASDE